jgi:hypothetical protein
MMVVQGRGSFPIKFNGGLFVWANETGAGYDADFRQWGGKFWFQNTRSVRVSRRQSLYILQMAATLLRRRKAGRGAGAAGAPVGRTA